MRTAEGFSPEVQINPRRQRQRGRGAGLRSCPARKHPAPAGGKGRNISLSPSSTPQRGGCGRAVANFTRRGRGGCREPPTSWSAAGPAGAAAPTASRTTPRSAPQHGQLPAVQTLSSVPGFLCGTGCSAVSSLPASRASFLTRTPHLPSHSGSPSAEAAK